MSDLNFITDNQLRTFQAAFDHYDKSKQGMISINDISKALKLIGIIITYDDLQNMLSSSLIDEETQLFDFPEFVSIIYYYLRGADTQEELIRAFSSFDTDHDGKIPIGLMSDILTNLKHPIPKERADELLERYKDNDLIDYKQFIKKVRP